MTIHKHDGETKDHDPRYDYYRCECCGRVWQQIDWNSALHQLTCEARATWATREAR